MAKQIEICYYNSFILTGGRIPGLWHIEESRIKGDYNGISTDYGARAYATDNDYGIRRRSNAMVYSGIFNSKTKTNRTNEFSIAESITRAVDVSNGSIQKLHAEDTNLNIFQQHKVSKALIDKDAIYTAEGVGLTSTGARVIGEIIPYTGKFGISDNPESFAYYANRKYFVDKSRGAVLRLSQNGLEKISDYGMIDFFRDNLELVSSDYFGGGEIGRIYGMYDSRHDEYIVSMQHSSIRGGKKSIGSPNYSTATGFLTLGFSENSKGWVSFYSYKPNFGLSMRNQFYTFNTSNIYKHYKGSKYNNFYDSQFNDPSYVTLIMNDSSSEIKAFTTINYEGSDGWSMDRAEAENVSREGYTYSSQKEEAYKIPKKGVTILDNRGITIDVGFKLKESKYYADIRQKLPYASSDYNSTFNTNTFNTTLGIKGYHAEIDMVYHEPTGNGKKVELFAVSNEIKI